MERLLKSLKRPFNGSWEAVELTMLVFENILIRLPVKQILIFKSVSKFWRDVISTKYFILLHQSWSRRNPKYFIYYDAGELEDGRVREMYQMEPNGVYSASYFIPDFETVNTPRLISSFNGLICCVNDINPNLEPIEMDIRICNPATREVLLLPRGQPSKYTPTIGILYSNNFHFYKIFKFFIDPVDHESQCEVYNSNTGSWKQLGRVALYPLMDLSRLSPNHVCVNEKLYMFIGDEDRSDVRTSVLMVDINENLREIQLPADAESSFLIKFQGHFCFIDFTERNMFIWVYEEKDEGWCLLGMPENPCNWLQVADFDTVAAHGLEILLVYRDFEGLRHEIIYDLRVRMWKDFSVAENRNNQDIAVFPFFETLLPCSSSGSGRTQRFHKMEG